MKKIITLIILGMALNSCAQKVIINREIDTPEYGKMLLGSQSLDQFQKEPYKAWYDENYTIYPIDKTALEGLKKEKINSYNIIVFLGTWCGDSKRNFPRLMKILEETKFPEIHFTNSNEPQLFLTEFDPNQLNEKQWENLGFTAKQVKTILKYKEI